MTRETIDFGIDLGTTNSSISVLNGIKPEIIKNSSNYEVTPSAVYISKGGRLLIGERAKNERLKNPDNAQIEFKRVMGTSEMLTFKDAQRTMSPQELSAEVLKSLKNDVKMRLREDIRAAVITVPADFDLPQTNATNEAAKMAGFDLAPQIQEPIAAALAYGFQSPKDKVFWFVYDFGGGTFDASIMQLRDGAFTVVNHGGNNYLGGKDIDREIVNQIFVPQILNEIKIDNFTEENYRGAYAKLKGEAERVKIALSSREIEHVEIDQLFPDKDSYFEFDIDRQKIINIAEPHILRTIRICQKVLKDAHLNPHDIEKLVLVGGPTLAPYLREMLEDPSQGLGIPLEFSVDPLTVVAQGAAVFAGTQKLPQKRVHPKHENQLNLTLTYDPVGSDPEPVVGGKLSGNESVDFSGYHIEISKMTLTDSEFQADATGNFLPLSKRWTSGKIPVTPEGSFYTTLFAETGEKNIYEINVFNERGDAVSVDPNQLSYTIGNVITSQPLTHSINVALANNEVIRYLDKGTKLPARQINKLRTTKFLPKGASGEVLLIPAVGGENSRANRNRLLDKLKISGQKVKRDIPVNSEIEVEVLVDENRLLWIKAYLPILDEVFESQQNLTYPDLDQNEMIKDIESQKERLERIIPDSEEPIDPKISQLIERLEIAKELKNVDNLIKNAKNMREDLNQVQERLLEIKINIDQVEGETKWPNLIEDANEAMDFLNNVVDEFGNDRARQAQVSLEVETNRAIETHDPGLLEQKNKSVWALAMDIWQSHPSFWVGGLDYMKENQSKMTDPAKAKELIQAGEKYMQQQDVDRLRFTVHELAELLPEEKRGEHDYGFGSTVIK